MFLSKVNPYINDSKAAYIKTIKQESIEKNYETLKNFANTQAAEKGLKKGTSNVKEAGKEGGTLNEANNASGDEEETLEIKDGELFTRKKRGIISSL